MVHPTVMATALSAQLICSSCSPTGDRIREERVETSWHEAVKRRLGKLVVFLLLGACINIAIAWGSALWVDGMALETLAEGIEGVTAADHPRWHVSIASSGTSTLVQAGATRKLPGPPTTLRADATKEEIDAWISGVALPVIHEVVPVPYWSRTSTPPIESEYETGGVWEDALGWPMRSMVWHLVRRMPDAPDRHLWAIDLGGMQGPVGLPRALPWRPIPIGFVVNSLLYAACLWLMISVPFDVRRMIRRKRGRCLKCGYDLRHAEHDVCPECGA